MNLSKGESEISASAPEASKPLPWGTRRGQVVRDRNGQLWRRSNGPNIYPINSEGHRLRVNGELIYMRIDYVLDPKRSLAPFYLESGGSENG